MMIERVKEILAEELSLELDEIKDDSDIREDLGADSLDMVQLVMSLEDEFDLEIENDEIQSVTTVEGIVEFIKKKRG
ncbi:acyl carrier protein [Clostridia bacterium]|nr:acyl carrier protein [Clostridia bacterium]